MVEPCESDSDSSEPIEGWTERVQVIWWIISNLPCSDVIIFAGVWRIFRSQQTCDSGPNGNCFAISCMNLRLGSSNTFQYHGLRVLVLWWLLHKLGIARPSKALVSGNRADLQQFVAPCTVSKAKAKHTGSGAVIFLSQAEQLKYCDTMWHDVTRCDTMWHDVTRCDTMWHDVTRCDTMWHDVTRCDTVTRLGTRQGFVYRDFAYHKNQPCSDLSAKRCEMYLYLF